MAARPTPGRLLGSAALAAWGALNLGAAALAATENDDWLLGVVLGLGAWLLLAVLWWPRRPVTPDPDATVVVRPAWWLRLGGTLAGLIGAGLWANLLGLVAPDDETVVVTGLLGSLLAVVLGAIGVVCLGAAWIAWWMRQSVSPHGATVRVLGRTSRIAASDPGTSVRVEGVVLHAGSAGGGIALPRVVVESEVDGRPVRAGFDPASTCYDAAVTVLDGWVARRADLVADDRTRDFLADRARAAVTSAGGRRAPRRGGRGR